MGNSYSAEVWLDERRWDALEAALEEQGTNIEKYLQDYLVDLYREMVPADQVSGDRVLHQTGAAGGAARGRGTESFLCIPPMGWREKPLSGNRISERVSGYGPAPA